MRGLYSRTCVKQAAAVLFLSLHRTHVDFWSVKSSRFLVAFILDPLPVKGRDMGLTVFWIG